MKKWFKKTIQAILLSVLLTLLVSSAVLAAYAYAAPLTITETVGIDRGMLPVITDAPISWMITNDYMEDDGSDTRVQTASEIVRPHMVTDEQVLTAATLNANTQLNLNFTTGNIASSSMDIIAGDGGYITTPDDADLELGDTFTIEINDAYVDTDDGWNKHIVQKNGAFGINISGSKEISGIVYYNDPVELVPAGFNAWTDVDVTAYVPATATGIVVHLAAPDGVAKEAGVRINGSVDALKGSALSSHGWTIVGIDSGDIFELFLEDAATHCYLVGFTGSSFTFKTAADDISLPGAAAWVDIDLSTEAPNATGAIIVILSSDAALQDFGLKMKGSADNRTNDIQIGGISWGIIGCDGSQVIEGWAANGNVDFHLVGYTTANVNFFTDGVDKSLAAGFAAWTDIDCSGDISGFATHIIFEVIQPGPAGLDYGFRRNGSTEDIRIDAVCHFWAIVECDESQVVQGWAENANVDWFIIGYTEGYIANPAELIVTATGIENGEHDITVTGDGVNFEISIDSAVAGNGFDTTAFGGVTVPNNNYYWLFFKSTTMPYVDYYRHTATGALRINYQPNDVVVNTRYNGTADAGGDTDTIIDAELTQADHYWLVARVTILTTTDTLAPQGETSVCSAFAAATDEVTVIPAFTAGVDAGDTYRIEFGTLVDRQGGDEDGRITWGANPTGVTVVLSSLVSSAQPSLVVDIDQPARDVMPEIETTDWFIEPAITGSLLTNPMRPLVTLVSDNTTITELQSWRWLGIAIVLLVTITGAKLVPKHLAIACFAGATGTMVMVVMTIWPLWTLVLLALFAIGGWVSERSPSL